MQVKKHGQITHFHNAATHCLTCCISIPALFTLLPLPHPQPHKLASTFHLSNHTLAAAMGDAEKHMDELIEASRAVRKRNKSTPFG